MDELIPKESKTIAAVRAKRLSERLSEARKSIKLKEVWWNTPFIEWVSLLLIFILNAFMVFPFHDFPAIENTFSGPVIPLIGKAISRFGVEYLISLQIVNIFLLTLLPITFYFFVKVVSKRKLIALLSSLILILPYHPFLKARVDASVFGIDAAHIVGLTIIPFALSNLFSFIRSGGYSHLVFAAISSATVALTTPFGFLTYLIIAGILAFSEVLLGSGRLKFTRALVVFLFAGGLISFWYNPAFFFWMLTGPLGEDIRYTISRVIPLSFFTLPVIGTFGYVLFDRKPTLQPVFISSFFLITFVLISVAGGGIFPSHSSRYVYELGLSVALIVSLIFVKLVDFGRINQKLNFKIIPKNVLLNFVTVGFVIFLIVITVTERNSFTLEETQVLGTWDEVEKGDIWKAKEGFSGAHSFLGYTITAITCAALVIMRKFTSQKKIA